LRAEGQKAGSRRLRHEFGRRRLGAGDWKQEIESRRFRAVEGKKVHVDGKFLVFLVV
jgi:hypothetical protein